jgi:hypothetical protein
MALRDKLRERCLPHLENGETIEQVFLAQTGPSPYWLFLTYLVCFWTKYRIVAVTDRSIAVFDAGIWSPAKPKRLWARLPRETPLGPVSGLWGKISLNGVTHHVHKRFHKDIAAATS